MYTKIVEKAQKPLEFEPGKLYQDIKDGDCIVICQHSTEPSEPDKFCSVVIKTKPTKFDVLSGMELRQTWLPKSDFKLFPGQLVLSNEPIEKEMEIVNVFGGKDESGYPLSVTPVLEEKAKECLATKRACEVEECKGSNGPSCDINPMQKNNPPSDKDVIMMAYPGTFEWALCMMKQGKKVYRKFWAKGAFCAFEKDEIMQCNSIGGRMGNHFIGDDFLATDWELYEEKGEA